MNRICWFRKSVLTVGVVLAVFSICRIAKGSASVDLQWDANPDPSVTGYNVYYGGASHTYTNEFSVGNTTNAMVTGLAEGKEYYFAVTAYDAEGDESDFSDETTYIVPGWVTLTPGTNPGDPVRIQFPVAAGLTYELQSSLDLQTWNTIWETTGVSNEWVEFDVPIGSAPASYYRVLQH